MNNSPLLTQVLSEFEEIFIGDKRTLYQKQDFKGYLSQVIEKVERETREKEHAICKKVYIDGADWAEWGISDDKASENFETVENVDRARDLLTKFETEVREKTLEVVEEKIISSFMEVAGLVWGIEMARKSWTDEEMKLFNSKVVDIRNRLLEELNTPQEGGME